MNYRNKEFLYKGYQILAADMVQKSVTYNGTDKKLELSGDSATPGNSKYYGTNGSGTKGFYDLPGGESGVTKEPMGFPNLTDSTVSYNLATRKLTVSGTFDVYNQGTKYSKSSITEEVIHGTSIGLYYVYYAGATLTVSAVNTEWDFSIHTPVAIIYYNGTAATTLWAGAEAIVFEERHGVTMDWATHENLHHSIGTLVDGAGFALSGTYEVATGTGGLAATSYGVDAGIIMDEDLRTSITALSDNAGVGNQYPVFYRVGTGSEWRWYINNLPLLIQNNNLLYNQLNGSTWQLTEISSNNTYMNMYLCAVPYKTSGSGSSYKFIWIMGQNTYSTLLAAEGESIQDLNLTGTPFSEIAPLWKVTLRYATTYSTASGKARIEATTKIVGTRLSISATFNPQDHNNLSGRSSANSHPGTAVAYDNTTSKLNAIEMQAAIDELAAKFKKLRVGGVV